MGLEHVERAIHQELVEAVVEGRPREVGPEAPEPEAGRRRLAARVDGVARGPADPLVLVVAVVGAGGDEDVHATLVEHGSHRGGEVALGVVDQELETGALARGLDLPAPARRLLGLPQGDGEVDHALAGGLEREEGRPGADRLVVRMGSEVQDGEHAAHERRKPA